MATILAVITALAIGWYTFRGKVYDAHLAEDIEQMDKLSFEVKTPTKVPFKEMKVMDVEIDGKQQAVISLINVDKERLDIQMSELKPEFSGVTSEQVVIGEDSQAKFIPNLSGRRILTWQEDDVFYEIIFYPKLTPREVSKRQLVKMAESF
ncbi:hypothetical protein IMZ31_05650 [Pontibacillus sp. ALD_SL1]|uniref:hypothetical protein n=1 Tax=Pontibacillus sp. ALD_SL1 TaxID=2777185 RepID=UPI001A9727F6|nr:hypothetical protein [Pontibacillus sp. ALD_SL1]QST01051.1 hypothetical protein IMZ31_05650 [Pontibacillus sp. ALD_SL1]